jgi:AcrR family transcriptional regulator
MPTTARDRLVQAAFDLFGRQGYEQTTVDEIAARAGVGRTTFFRLFSTKEAVVLPDHDALLGRVAARLAAGRPETAMVAVADAATLVLRHYLAEGDVARERYRLTRSVPTLRAAEIAGQRRYQQLFRDHLRDWLEGAELRAEVLANAVVTTHNHVLRRWLRAETTTPEADLAHALHEVLRRLWDATPAAGPTTTQVLVLRTSRDVEEIVPALRRLLDEASPAGGAT